MPRNAEVIRQWTILRELESSRRLTIDEMAEKTGVTTRTIRRDLEALQFVGFPIYDELYDGKSYWMLEQKAFKRLDTTGFTFAELSALYFSRTLVECLSPTPFQEDVTSAFDKLADALTPGMRQFLDRLPLVIQAKAGPGSQPAARAPGRSRSCSTPRCSTAARSCAITPSPASARRNTRSNHRAGLRAGRALSGRLRAGVLPALRTFAVDRIKSLSVTEERFEPAEPTKRSLRALARGAPRRPRSASRSRSSRRSPATSGSASGIRRRSFATRRTAGSSSPWTCRTTSRCAAGFSVSVRWPSDLAAALAAQIARSRTARMAAMCRHNSRRRRDKSEG